MSEKSLFRGDMPTTAGTAEYTVPTGYKTYVTNVDICNTTAGILTPAVHLVPSGGSAGTTNMLFPNPNLLANQMVQWEGRQEMVVGDFIQCIGSSAGLTIHITGEEVRVST